MTLSRGTGSGSHRETTAPHSAAARDAMGSPSSHSQLGCAAIDEGQARKKSDEPQTKISAMKLVPNMLAYISSQRNETRRGRRHEILYQHQVRGFQPDRILRGHEMSSLQVGSEADASGQRSISRTEARAATASAALIGIICRYLRSTNLRGRE
jgi:hypothetical protein